MGHKISKMKEKADKYYDQGNFIKAIEKYKKVEVLQKKHDKVQPIVYMSIAMCYRKMEDWEEIIMNTNQAIDLDEKYVLAYRLRGTAKIEKAKYIYGEDAIAAMKSGLEDLVRAKTLCIGQNKEEYEDELNKCILLAKKIIYYKDKENNNQLKEDMNHFIRSSIDKFGESLREKDYLKEEYNDLIESQEVEENVIPEYLICPLTKNLLMNPILLSSGNSYEKKDIEKYFVDNGYFDPISKDRVSETLIANLNLRHALEEFLEKNPWGYMHKENESYKQISFD